MTQLIDAYLKGVDAEKRRFLEHIRSMVHELVPDAEEVISYGMPAFKLNKQPLLYFAAFKNHMSLFPAGDTDIAQLHGASKFHTSKGTLQFTVEEPIPDELLRSIILFRADKLR